MLDELRAICLGSSSPLTQDQEKIALPAMPWRPPPTNHPQTEVSSSGPSINHQQSEWSCCPFEEFLWEQQESIDACIFRPIHHTPNWLNNRWFKKGYPNPHYCTPPSSTPSILTHSWHSMTPFSCKHDRVPKRSTHSLILSYTSDSNLSMHECTSCTTCHTRVQCHLEFGSSSCASSCITWVDYLSTNASHPSSWRSNYLWSTM